jgi:hypothetical protein
VSGFWKKGAPLPLDAMRFEVDPVADAVVEAIYGSHKDAGVAALLDGLGRSSESFGPAAGAHPSGGPLALALGRHRLNLHWTHASDQVAVAGAGSAPASETYAARLRARLVAEHPGGGALEPWAETLCEFFSSTATLPDWADQEKIERGCRLALLYGILDTLILCCASLPWCYLDANGVPVLASTGRLQGQRVYRRIWETSHFVVNAVAPGGLGPNGKGIFFAQRVRLLHAAVRNRLLAPPRPAAAAEGQGSTAAAMQATAPKHDWKKIGLPLNQEDMAYVLLTFSYAGIAGLRKLGATPSADDADAYIHLWNVVGHVLGIRQDLMAETFEDAEALFHVLVERVRKASPEGKALTSSLVTWMEEVAPGHTDSVPRIVLTHLLGRENAAVLGVELTTLQKLRAPFTVNAIRTITQLVEFGRREVGTGFSVAVRKIAFRTVIGSIWNRHRQNWADLARFPSPVTGDEDMRGAAAH